ncbi:MAG: hypothetical protein QG555_1017 [Thermodesulfobacteriota bacterium]|nr:hypothetical protein [Thermodesulfobacteriota bacterium]
MSGKKPSSTRQRIKHWPESERPRENHVAGNLNPQRARILLTLAPHENKGCASNSADVRDVLRDQIYSSIP